MRISCIVREYLVFFPYADLYYNRKMVVLVLIFDGTFSVATRA